MNLDISQNKMKQMFFSQNLKSVYTAFCFYSAIFSFDFYCPVNCLLIPSIFLFFFFFYLPTV